MAEKQDVAARVSTERGVKRTGDSPPEPATLKKRCSLSLRSKDHVAHCLAQVAGPELVSSRSGGGGTIDYLAGRDATALANTIFGYDGWTQQLLEHAVVQRMQDKNIHVVLFCAKVRVVLSDDLGGAVREEVGYGLVRDKCPYTALLRAHKSANTDGLKRALALIGEPFNCFKDGKYLGWAKRARREGPSLLPYSVEDAIHVRPLAGSASPVLKGTSVDACKVEAVKMEEEDEYGYDSFDDVADVDV